MRQAGPFVRLVLFWNFFLQNPENVLSLHPQKNQKVNIIMANHKSSEKRIRNTETKRTLNKYQARTVRNAVKKLRTTTETETLEKELPAVVAKIDKLAKKSVIHKNKAANLKSKLMKKANAAKAKV